MRILALLMIVCTTLTATQAAEVQLRDVCHVADTVVRLGDIADVYDEDQAVAKRLASTEICPAPFVGQRRTLTHRQIRDHLSRGGWNLVEHQLSGAAQVVIHADQRIRLATAALSTGRPVSSVAKRSAHQRAESVLLASLHNQFGEQKQEVTFRLTPAQARVIGECRGRLKLEQSLPAGSGTRRVELKTDKEVVNIVVEVVAPKAVVTTRRTVPKGKIISLDDVELNYSNEAIAKRDGVERLEDVLGQETTTRLSPGQVVLSRHARR
ncbi:MAG: SAF domain-containing protein, partial [Pirellulales bacterium]|nr:SAF domain-containing protein [Pirellulales bacterium]